MPMASIQCYIIIMCTVYSVQDNGYSRIELDASIVL